MIGIMQPYFFPYIGYFQLIKAVDSYVNLDHVSFMKRSYMIRNTLKNNIGISVPVAGASQNRTCVDVKTLSDSKWFDKFYKTLELNYKKEPCYGVVMSDVIEPWKREVLSYDSISISSFNFSSIMKICKYLDIDTNFIETSCDITKRKRNEGLQDIIKHFNHTEYVNAIGGISLYNKEDFKSVGVDLKFIEMGDLDIDNQYASILDLLFRYDKSDLKEELNKFKLI